MLRLVEGLRAGLLPPGSAPESCHAQVTRPPRLETTERRCPTCRAQRVASMGQIVAVAAQVKEKCWCEACGREFRFVRTVIALE